MLSFCLFFPRMVPTTVERLREGQGVRERLLRGIKVERSGKRADGSTEMESGEKNHQTLEIKLKVEGEQLALDSDVTWKTFHLLVFCKDSEPSDDDGCDVLYKWTFGLTPKSMCVFPDADQYELQAASSPMKSPHRYSPSVFSQQVPHTLATAPAELPARVHVKLQI